MTSPVLSLPAGIRAPYPCGRDPLVFLSCQFVLAVGPERELQAWVDTSERLHCALFGCAMPLGLWNETSRVVAQMGEEASVDDIRGLDWLPYLSRTQPPG